VYNYVCYLVMSQSTCQTPTVPHLLPSIWNLINGKPHDLDFGTSESVKIALKKSCGQHGELISPTFLFPQKRKLDQKLGWKYIRQQNARNFKNTTRWDAHVARCRKIICRRYNFCGKISWKTVGWGGYGKLELKMILGKWFVRMGREINVVQHRVQ
jgi:hypothetical protein